MALALLLVLLAFAAPARAEAGERVDIVVCNCNHDLQWLGPLLRRGVPVDVTPRVLVYQKCGRQSAAVLRRLSGWRRHRTDVELVLVPTPNRHYEAGCYLHHLLLFADRAEPPPGVPVAPDSVATERPPGLVPLSAALADPPALATLFLQDHPGHACDLIGVVQRYFRDGPFDRPFSLTHRLYRNTPCATLRIFREQRPACEASPPHEYQAFCCAYIAAGRALLQRLPAGHWEDVYRRLQRWPDRAGAVQLELEWRVAFGDPPDSFPAGSAGLTPIVLNPPRGRPLTREERDLLSCVTERTNRTPAGHVKVAGVAEPELQALLAIPNVQTVNDTRGRLQRVYVPCAHFDGGCDWGPHGDDLR